MHAEMIASEQSLSFMNSVAQETKEEFVCDLASKSISDHHISPFSIFIRMTEWGWIQIPSPSLFVIQERSLMAMVNSFT